MISLFTLIKEIFTGQPLISFQGGLVKQENRDYRPLHMFTGQQ